MLPQSRRRRRRRCSSCMALVFTRTRGAPSQKTWSFRGSYVEVARNLMSHAKPAPKDGLTKFQRYRRTQADKGMKLLRVWVPDPTRPEFAKEAARQGRLLRGRPEQAEALAFIEAAFSWGEE
jgi:Protein  of unknown function (DUF3018)